MLEFTQGNPLTVTVLVGQALRDGLTTRTQIEAFVARLRAGAAAITDDAEQGRDKSLGASLSYGFDHAFTEAERAQLALLHLFQGFVYVEALRMMGDPDAEHCIPEIRGLTREAGIGLLHRAAEIGLITPVGDGYYAIHPAVPWFFQQLFIEHYGLTEQQTSTRAIWAYVEAIGVFALYHHRQYSEGHTEVIDVLGVEEANLLRAHELARTHRWWYAGTSTVQGLYVLYEHTGRASEFRRLVDKLVPYFVDPVTEDPLPGSEEGWRFVTDFRIRLAFKARDWATAGRLQDASLAWDRERAAPALAVPAETLDDEQRNRLRNLALSVEMLGALLLWQERPECVECYDEAIHLYRRIGDRQAEAVVAFNLGNAYILRDLDQAEHWYRRALELYDEADHLSRAQCVKSLGTVAYQRFKGARDAGAAREDLDRHWKAAAAACREALDLLPEDAIDDLAATHHQLGLIYDKAKGLLDTALVHHRKALHYKEVSGDPYGAGTSRFDIAVALKAHGRLGEALLYAQAALRDFEQVGAGAAAAIDETQQLIAQIKQHLT